MGISEARAVIDSVRVARAIAGTGVSSRFIVWGHSQGGQAALFTGMIVKAYAPELALLGVAAAAPATELARLINDDIDTPGGKSITAMTLWSWQRVYDAPMSKIVDPRAMPAVNRLAQECIEGPYDLMIRRRTERPLEQHFLTVDRPGDLEPWHSLLAKNTPGLMPADLPVFFAQGTSDQLVRPKITQDYASMLCNAGSKVRMLVMPNISHGMAARASALTAADWMTARFAAEPAPDDSMLRAYQRRPAAVSSDRNSLKRSRRPPRRKGLL